MVWIYLQNYYGLMLLKLVFYRLTGRGFYKISIYIILILHFLQNAKPSERRHLLETHIRTQIYQILGFSPDEIDAEAGFFDLGMDSLTSVDLKNRLQKSLGFSLSSTVIFDRPNLNALIDYLVEEMGLENDEVEQKPVEEETESEELSEDDIADLLAQELMEIERGKES